MSPEFIKIWTDESRRPGHRLRTGFFNEKNTLIHEIPVEDCNSDNVEGLEKELEEAHNLPVKRGHIDKQILEEEKPIYSSQRILREYRLNPETAYSVFMSLTHSNMREIAESAGISRNTVQNYKNKFSEMHEDERLILYRYLLEEELWGRLGEITEQDGGEPGE